MSKEAIFAAYANRIYFGSGYYGVEAAALGYFGVRASALEPHQAATLAAMIRSPGRLSPRKAPERLQALRDAILRAMSLAEADLAAALAAPIRALPYRSDVCHSSAVDLVRAQISGVIGLHAATTGGYTIRTTVDAKLQAAAETAVREAAAQADAAGGGETQSAALAVSSEGAVLAVAGSRDRRRSEFNRAVQGSIRAGTAILPLIYGFAFSRGLPPSWLLEDGPLDNRRLMVGGEDGVAGEWGGETEWPAYGPALPAAEALVRGKIGPAVRMVYAVGVEALLSDAHFAGFSALAPVPSSCVGEGETTLAELVRAFIAIPSGGEIPAQLHIIHSISAYDGSEVFRHGADYRVRILAQEAAWQVHGLLDTASGNLIAARGLEVPPWATVVPGTSYGFKDAVAVGYGADFVCALWVGHDLPQTIYPGAFGGAVAAPHCATILREAGQRKPASPGAGSATLTPICSRTGGAAQPICPRGTPIFLSPAQVRWGCHLHATAAAGKGAVPAAVPVDSGAPIPLMGPTVLGDDPYGAQPQLPPLDESLIPRAIPVESPVGE